MRGVAVARGIHGEESQAAARLLRAWRRTRYEAAGAVARVGCRSPEIDALLGRLAVRSGGFVTAWNPFSRKKPDGWNHRMQRRLVEAARRLPQAPGQGVGRGWREDHLLVGGDPRRLRALGRRFRQRGILLVRAGQAARLVFLA